MLIPELHGPEITMMVAIAWPVIIPAAISALSGLFGKKSQDAKSNEDDKMCQAQNQRRIAMIGAVAKAYNLDIKGSPELAALAAPRPCPDTSAGSTYGLLSDVLGGGALAAGSLMAGGQQQGQETAFGAGDSNLPCPPGQIRIVPTGPCIDPAEGTKGLSANG